MALEPLEQLTSFRFRELPCGHDAMVVLPQATADLLLEV
jgi:hypothetical protein